MRGIKVQINWFLNRFFAVYKEYIAQLNSRISQRYQQAYQSDLSESIDSGPISPVSSVKHTPFNPFSAARVGNALYGLPFANKGGLPRANTAASKF